MNLPKIKLKSYLKKKLTSINYRCNNWHPYTTYDIKNFLTVDDLMFLWKRDNADKMKKPSIDRIDPDESYSLPNCRFLELSENSKRRRVSIEPKVKMNCKLCGLEFMGWACYHKYCSPLHRKLFHGRYRLVDGKLTYQKSLPSLLTNVK